MNDLDDLNITDVMVRVVYHLKNKGFEASVEYPGYIAIGHRCYGTINGVWGWNIDECTMEDDDSGESNIPGACQDVDAIVRWIIRIENIMG